MSYVHWQYQTAQGHPKPLTLDEFARLGPDGLQKLLGVLSVEEKIGLLAVSPEMPSVHEIMGRRTCRRSLIEVFSCCHDGY
jgi:hypothetical protein